MSLLKQPDLATQIVSSSCNVLLEGRTYKLDVAVWAEIENVGSANASDFHIKLVSPAGEDEEWVEGPLAPGEKKLIHLEATSEDWTCCCYPPAVPCPSGVSIEVTADSQEELMEPSEANNTAEDECPCS